MSKLYTGTIEFEMQIEADNHLDAEDYALNAVDLPEGFVPGSLRVKDIYTEDK